MVRLLIFLGALCTVLAKLAIEIEFELNVLCASSDLKQTFLTLAEFELHSPLSEPLFDYSDKNNVLYAKSFDSNEHACEVRASVLPTR